MGDNRLTRIVTRGGDEGTTGLADGSRLPKSHPRIVAIGEVDELNATIGMLAVAPGIDFVLQARLRELQQRLFDLGGELSMPGGRLLDRAALAVLDEDIVLRNAALPPLAEFVIPGGNEANARAHLARTVCRRAERSLWALVETLRGETTSAGAGDIATDSAAIEAVIRLARYANRLSDWLFVVSRELAPRPGEDEALWRRPATHPEDPAPPPRRST